ncbi:MAG: MFS transporter, partial [Mesorhizobium sp.]
MQLLFLAGLVAAGVAAFEVVLALRGRSLGMTPYQVGIMFAECSMVMFAVQGLVFSPLVAPSSTAKLITPTLVIMATGLFLVPYAETFAAQLVVIGSVAAGAGRIQN